MDYNFVKRYEGNPIVTRDDIKDIPGGCNSVFNTSIFKVGSKYKGIFRVEQRSGIQSMRLGDSDDGIKFKIHPQRLLLPQNKEQALYEEAIYDPRVVNIGGTYYITYASENIYGCQVAMASTRDFKTFKRYGCVSEPENRNLVLFPEKIKGKYYRLDRPFQHDAGFIWLQESPDLIYWGNPRCIMQSRRFAWDRGKIGAGAPPIRIKEGWLVLYHGTTPLCNNLIYRLGVAILDYEKPWIVKHRAKAYILSPDAEYERVGDVPNVCFLNGAIADSRKDELRLYYGASDQSVCLATCRLSDMIKFAKTM